LHQHRSASDENALSFHLEDFERSLDDEFPRLLVKRYDPGLLSNLEIGDGFRLRQVLANVLRKLIKGLGHRRSGLRLICEETMLTFRTAFLDSVTHFGNASYLNERVHSSLKVLSNSNICCL